MDTLDIAIELAKEAGQIQLESLGKVHQVEYKGVTNIVTEVDKRCEALIIGRLQKEFPEHEILTEETGYVAPHPLKRPPHLLSSPSRGEELKEGVSIMASDIRYRWIIDPLDGTVNYTHTYPLFAVSIALERKGEIILGVVFEPNRGELFVAEAGAGATLNDRRIKVSKTNELRKALLDTGFAYNIHEGEKENNVRHFVNFLMNARAIRRDGVAATDLCYVACGRFDGFWELYLKPWDIAAGQLIIKEAGGEVSAFNGSPLDIYGTEILASNGKIHGEMINVLTKSK